MATTAVLHANDTHKTEQSPHSIHTSSPLVRGYSPNQNSVYNVAGVSPQEGSTSASCASTNFQQANYPLPPTRDAFQDLTPEPPAEECPSQVQVCSANFIGSSTVNSTDNSEVTVICDPFYEPPARNRPPQTVQPLAYPNMGDPKCSGIRLELPRNLRVPYPESAFEAVTMLNKAFSNLQPPPPPLYMSSRSRAVQYVSGPPRGVYPGSMNSCGISPSYPAPTPSPSGMSPSYMQQVRVMGCPKSCNSQMTAPYGFPNVPYGPGGSVMPNLKKSQTTTGGRRKQNAKAAVEERAAKAMRKMDFNVPCGSMYEQMGGDMGRPSTSAANNFGPMPSVMASNPALMSGQPSSTPSPPNPQMMMHGGRSQYPYDGSMMSNNNPNMQPYQQMQPMNNQECSGLMRPPSLPMRVNGQMSNPKGVEMNPMQKSAIFQQSGAVNPEMQPDGLRMFDGRSMEKNNQYQMHSMSSGQNDIYGGINGNISSNSGFSQTNPNSQRCGLCKEEIRDSPSIQCTGNGQGCLRYFHQNCSQMMAEPFQVILNEPCAEWICNDCDRQRQIMYS